MESAPSDGTPVARDRDELVTLFAGDVWRFASASVRCREDAEDVVMETFAAAFRDFDGLRRVDNQRYWLLDVARKRVADCHRKRYRRAERPLSEADSASAPAPSPLGLAAREALGRLPDPQREVLTLKYVSGLSVEEIGLVIRRSPAATNSLLQRGRKGLRKDLGLDDLPESNPTGEKR